MESEDVHPTQAGKASGAELPLVTEISPYWRIPCLATLTPQTSPPHLSRCLQIHKLGLFDPKEGQGLRDLYSSKALQLTFMQESEDVLQQVSRKMGKTRNDGIKSQCCCSISKL